MLCQRARTFCKLRAAIADNRRRGISVDSVAVAGRCRGVEPAAAALSWRRSCPRRPSKGWRIDSDAGIGSGPLAGDHSMTAPVVEDQPRRRWMFWLRLAAGIGLVSILAARTDWRPVAAALTGLRFE